MACDAVFPHLGSSEIRGRIVPAAAVSDCASLTRATAAPRAPPNGPRIDRVHRDIQWRRLAIRYRGDIFATVIRPTVSALCARRAPAPVCPSG